MITNKQRIIRILAFCGTDYNNAANRILNIEAHAQAIVSELDKLGQEECELRQRHKKELQDIEDRRSIIQSKCNHQWFNHSGSRCDICGKEHD